MVDRAVNHAGRSTDYASAMETMGDRIKMLREAKGLTQEQLGKLVGVSKAAVSQWELGQAANIKLQTFLNLLNVLGVKYEYLIYGPNRPPGGSPRSSAALRDS